jgi:hypothetical protein
LACAINSQRLRDNFQSLITQARLSQGICKGLARTSPGWRNGRRFGLKIRFPKGSAGSIPAPGISSSAKYAMTKEAKFPTPNHSIWFSQQNGQFFCRMAP